MNKPAVCHLSVVPIRAGASDKEEIVSQLLFGELVDVLEISKSKKNWCQVKCDWDGYEGWMDVRQLTFINPDEVNNYRENTAMCLDLASNITNSDHFMMITIGAILPSFDGVNLRLGDKHYTFGGQAILRGSIDASPHMIIKIARRYLYTPYLWGGRSAFGIDCSGFTQMVYKFVDIRLRRDASQQIEQGKTIDFIEQAQLGDLVFFDNDKGKIVHVGIMMDNNYIIHASGQLRIDKIDHYGIFNEERGIYSHKLRIIKRMLPDMIFSEDLVEKVEVEPEVKTQMSIF